MDKKIDIDKIIEKLLEKKGARQRKAMNLAETKSGPFALKVEKYYQAYVIGIGNSNQNLWGYSWTMICQDCLNMDYPPEANYLFLGEQVDRGRQSLERICLLLAYKMFTKKQNLGINDQCIFIPDVIAQFLKKNNLDIVCRAHQVVEKGYDFYQVTLFSAPNQLGEFDGSGFNKYLFIFHLRCFQQVQMKL